MPVERSGPTPQFLEYVIDNAVIPRNGPPSQQLLDLTTHNFRWLQIPSYQRGIAWSVSQIEELMASNSILLGNVILGQFDVEKGQFEHLPESVTKYAVLVDGLQRFSVGTILLALLYPKVLSATPEYAADAHAFSALAARSVPLAPIFMHNSAQLSNHPRKAVADAYASLKASLDGFLREKLDSGDGVELAKLVCDLFLTKQVAIDLYFNFETAIELTNTFIGINTVRVDLSPVDLLRSYIVDRCIASNWVDADIEDMENRFTEVFTDNEKPKTNLLPFVAILLNQLTSPGSENHIFPSWLGKLQQNEVDDFLDFVTEVQGTDDNGYLREIKATGAIPFAGVLAFYYRQLVTQGGVKPSFVTGGNAEDEELHRYLCANLRAFLAGKIGRTREYSEKLLRGELASLSEAAEQMSIAFVSKSVSDTVEQDWLSATIRRIDKKRAPRIFNAMRLPVRATGWGGSFVPDVYGTKSVQYHIDHLIPASTVKKNQPGELELDTLVNFAPLTSDLNRVAKATPCSNKLATKGIYDNYLQTNVDPHPYCDWLVANQGCRAADLDRQELLIHGQTPDLITPRVDYLVGECLARI